MNLETIEKANFLIKKLDALKCHRVTLKKMMVSPQTLIGNVTVECYNPYNSFKSMFTKGIDFIEIELSWCEREIKKITREIKCLK